MQSHWLYDLIHILTVVFPLVHHLCFTFLTESMASITETLTNYTTDGFNDTTPKLPETPLHQDISNDFGLFFYVFIILIGTWLLLHLC